jgi:hypothetical protein
LIEDGSQTPKTSLGRRAAIEQLNQLGFLDKNDAEQRYTILKAFGATDLLPSLDNDVKSALSEQDAFERWSTDKTASALMPMMGLGAMDAGTAGALPPGGAVPPAEGSVAPGMLPAEPAPSEPGSGGAPAPMSPAGGPPPQGLPFLGGQRFATPFPMRVQYWQRDDVHNAEHRKWANSDNAAKLFAERPELIPEFTQHMQLHDFSAITKAAQQAMLQAGATAGAGKGAEGTGQALERSNKESGNPADVPKGQGQGAQGRGPE